MTRTRRSTPRTNRKSVRSARSERRATRRATRRVTRKSTRRVTRKSTRRVTRTSTKRKSNKRTSRRKVSRKRTRRTNRNRRNLIGGGNNPQVPEPDQDTEGTDQDTEGTDQDTEGTDQDTENNLYHSCLNAPSFQNCVELAEKDAAKLKDILESEDFPADHPGWNAAAMARVPFYSDWEWYKEQMKRHRKNVKEKEKADRHASSDYKGSKFKKFFKKLTGKKD